jgi:DNA polymerase-4
LPPVIKNYLPAYDICQRVIWNNIDFFRPTSEYSAMKRTILHVDMDAFFASVEQLDHPEYAGKPVVVGSPRDKRGVVSAASYEARKYGIHSAMPSREAARRCPKAIFLPVNMARYKEMSTEVFAIFDKFTPHKEPISIDEAFLDVTGALRILGTGPEIALQIKTAVKTETGLTASVGVAINKFLAKVASDLEKPDGITVVPSEPDQIKEFIAPQEIGRIWGVGKVTRKKLELAGYFTIGQLQQASSERLIKILGEHSANHLSAMAIGEDTRNLEMDREQKSFSREYTFAEDCNDSEELERVLCSLVEDVGSQLRAAGKYSNTVQLKLRWQDFETITRQRRFSSPCCDDSSLRELVMAIFLEQEIIKPVRLIGFGVSNVVAKKPPEQIGLFETGSKSKHKRETISRTVDDIRRKFGTDSISSAGTMSTDD